MSSYAQSTVTEDVYNYPIGSVFIRQSVDNSGFNTIAEGADQTWNYSALTSTGIDTSTTILPSATPNGNQFTNAVYSTYQNGSLTYSYNFVDNQKYEVLGIDRGETSTILNYTDPEKFMIFPFTYTSSFTDFFSCDFETNSIPTHRSGTVEVSYVGYGTLITAKGSFNDVILIKSHEIYTDSMDLAGADYVINYESMIYHWFKTGIAGPLFLYSESIASGQVIKFASYLENVDASVNIIEDKTVEIYPNPTKDYIVVNTKNIYTKIQILSQNGQVVLEKNINTNNLTINIQDIKSGVYLLKLINNKNYSVSKFIIE